VLKSTPFKNREKLEESFVNLFSVTNPGENVEDFSGLSTNDLMERYRGLQRDWSKKQSQKPEPEEPAIELQETKNDKLDNPLADSKINKAYENYITQLIQEDKLSYSEAKKRADKKLNDKVRQLKNERRIESFEREREQAKLDKLKKNTSFNLKRFKTDEKYNNVPYDEVLKELDRRRKLSGMTDFDLLKAGNTLDPNGDPYQLRQLYEDAYNSLLLKKTPHVIEKAREQGELEAVEKIKGGSPNVSPAGMPGKQITDKEKLENIEKFKLQQSLTSY